VPATWMPSEIATAIAHIQSRPADYPTSGAPCRGAAHDGLGAAAADGSARGVGPPATACSRATGDD
jgi:hypothetical protein